MGSIGSVPDCAARISFGSAKRPNRFAAGCPVRRFSQATVKPLGFLLRPLANSAKTILRKAAHNRAWRLVSQDGFCMSCPVLAGKRPTLTESSCATENGAGVIENREAGYPLIIGAVPHEERCQ
jgi:hypothetical protein